MGRGCVGGEIYRTEVFGHDSVLQTPNPSILKEKTVAGTGGDSPREPSVLAAHRIATILVPPTLRASHTYQGRQSEAPPRIL